MGTSGDEPRMRASPLARLVAREHGADLRSVRGPGRAGRVLRADVLAQVTAIQVTATPAGATPAGARRARGRHARARRGEVPVLDLGVERFMPVVPGEGAAVLGAGAVSRAVVEHEGAIAVRPRVQLTLTTDGRVPDAAAAGFLATLHELLERPARFLV